MAESLDELGAKLKLYQTQLTEVDILISSSPNDTSLTQLRTDLIQLINLTQDLARGVTKKSSVPPPLPTSSSSSLPPPLPVKRMYKASDRIMARYSDGQYYAARIDTINEGSSPSYVITYLDSEYGTQETIPEQHVKPYIQVNPDLLRPNTSIRAIWAGDGLFYDAVVEGPSTILHHYKIKYTKYKKKGEVHIYDIQMKLDHSTSTSTSTAKKELDEKIVIPDRLKIDKEKDSESVQLKKRAQIKRLKAEHRRNFLEQEGNKRKNSWLDFQKTHVLSKDGGTKKKRKIGLHMVEKKSMFASPDEVDGKVGVIGSGKKMTEYAMPKQHAYGEASSLPLPTDDDDQPPPLP